MRTLLLLTVTLAACDSQPAPPEVRDYRLQPPTGAEVERLERGTGPATLPAGSPYVAIDPARIAPLLPPGLPGAESPAPREPSWLYTSKRCAQGQPEAVLSAAEGVLEAAGWSGSGVELRRGPYRLTLAATREPTEGCKAVTLALVVRQLR